MEIIQGKIIQKAKNARVVFLVHDTFSQCDACTCIVIYSARFKSLPEHEVGPRDKRTDGRTCGTNRRDRRGHKQVTECVLQNIRHSFIWRRRTRKFVRPSTYEIVPDLSQ